MQTFRFELGELPPEAEALRAEVREFLRQELGDAAPVRRAHSWGGFDREFSKKMGARGWIAMTWPKRYGGHERSALERYVVLEEMLARRRAGVRPLDRRSPVRPAAPALRHRGAAAEVPAGDRARRAVVRDRHERARLGLRPRLAAHARRAGARRLSRQRHQGVDEQRAPGRLHDRDVPHEPRPGEKARGALAVPGGHEAAGHHDEPDHRSRGLASLQHGRLRRRLRARGHAGRRGRRGLEAGDDRARLRAQRAGAVSRRASRCCSS